MKPPLLIVMKGHPGSGKSAVARGLSRRLGIPLIDKDDIKDVLDGRTADSGGLAYIAMFSIARRQLMQRLSVICDSPLSEVGGYTTACVVAHDTGARVLIVECFCSSEDEWRRRIEQRGALRLPSHHITTWESLQQHLRRRADTSNYPIYEPHLLVDTIGPLEDVLQTIIAWIEEVSRSGGMNRGNPAG